MHELLILTIIVLSYIIYNEVDKHKVKEGMSTTVEETLTGVDLEAIRTLGTLAAEIKSSGGVTIPGNVIIQGTAKIGGSLKVKDWIATPTIQIQNLAPGLQPSNMSGGNTVRYINILKNIGSTKKSPTIGFYGTTLQALQSGNVKYWGSTYRGSAPPGAKTYE